MSAQQSGFPDCEYQPRQWWVVQRQRVGWFPAQLTGQPCGPSLVPAASAPSCSAPSCCTWQWAMGVPSSDTWGSSLLPGRLATKRRHRKRVHSQAGSGPRLTCTHVHPAWQAPPRPVAATKTKIPSASRALRQHGACLGQPLAVVVIVRGQVLLHFVGRLVLLVAHLAGERERVAARHAAEQSERRQARCMRRT